MRVLIGTVSAGSKPQDTNDPVEAIEFHARASNDSNVYLGTAATTANNARELTPGESFKMVFADLPAEGSVPFSSFFTAGTGKIDWVAILRS